MLTDAIEVLGWTLLHFVWQGAVVGMLAAMLLAALRRRSANVRYLTAVIALGLMLLLPLVTIAWIERAPSPGQVVPIFFPMVTTTTELVPSLDDSAEPTLMTIERVGIDMENPPPPGSRPLLPVSEINRLLEDLSEQQEASKAEPFLKPYISWVVAAWLIGVGVLSLRLFGSWWSVRRLRRQATQPAGESWQTLLVQLKDHLRVTRPVKLVESALVEVPAVIGWLRPVILLPATAMTGLTTEQLEALLAHELAHVRRHDYLINLLQTMVETLLFYHPAVWWLSHRIRIEREHCCDDLAASVCGDRLNYARALVAMEQLRGPKIGLAMSSKGGSLLSRVTRLLSPCEDQRPVGWIAGLIATLLLTVAGALGAGLLTPPENPTAGLPNEVQPTATESTDTNEETSGPTPAAGSGDPRRAEAKSAAATVKAEWVRMLEVNRKIPGTIPDSEIQQAKQTYEKALSQLDLSEQEKAEAQAEIDALEKAAKDLRVRFTAASEKVVKAEYEKILESNRRVPGAIPDPEVQRAKLNWELAQLRLMQAKADQAGREELELRMQVARKAADVADAEYEKILESNRKVPGCIPATEVERARLKVEKAKLEVEQVQHLLAVAKLSAIQRGVAFLKTQQQENGAWQGTPADGVTALCAAALLQAGVKADDPVMQKALAHLRTIKPTLSYTVALQTMVFCSASPKEDAELIRRNVAWLEKAQATEGPNRGGWSYMENNIKSADGSCSRFAMLGLHAAKKAGCDVKAETWRNASDYWMSSQRKENHAWGYQTDSTPTPSMTLSGMACLAIVNQHLPQDEQTKLRTEAIERAVPFVEPNAHLLWQSGHGGYALQCLERAAHLNRWQKFGKHELRKLIDEKLLGLQRPEGHWTGVGGSGGGFFGAAAEQTPEQKAAAEAARRLQVQSNDLIATSFALMCLTGQPEPKLVGYRLRFEPRDAGKKFQMQSSLIESSSPPTQRTVISGGVRIEFLKSDDLKCRIEADRAIIESNAQIYEELELNPISDVMRIECIGSVNCEDRRGAGSTQLTAERLWFDVSRNLIQADKSR